MVGNRDVPGQDEHVDLLESIDRKSTRSREESYSDQKELEGQG